MKCRHTEPVRGCRRCWLWAHDARYRTKWGGRAEDVTVEPVAPAAQPAALARLPCLYEGEPATWCHLSDERHKVRNCDHPQADWDWCARESRPNRGGQNCRECPLYATMPPPAKPDGWTRHLLFHIYPMHGNGAWERNVSRMVERLRIFNGKIIVAIAVDPPTGRKADPTGRYPPDRARHLAHCDDPDIVKAAFGEWRDRIEFLVVENDSHLREVVSLVPMLERLPNEPGHAALYAQAKGTTRSAGHIAHHWNDVQFIVYLDYWHLVAEQLAKYPVTGAFKKLGPGWRPEQSKSDWHYSGSWFWFRTADLFARDWRTIDQFWSGIEPYPSQQFLANEAGTLFHEAAVPRMNLYRPSYWRSVVDPALAEWRKTNVKYFNATHGI